MIAVMETVADRIRERLEISGLSARAASLAAGFSESYVSNILLGKSAGPRGDKASRMARVLGCSTDWLLTGSDDSARPRPGDEAVPAPVDVPAPADMPRDVPVMGTALGALIRQNFEGFDVGGPIEYVRRPPSLASVTGLYAIYVAGDSMDPMHPPGELRFVHPGRNPAPGDTVIVQTRHWDEDPGQAYIKILRRRTADRLIVSQLNPDATIEIPARFVVTVHRVLTMNEMFGF